ncbi:iron-siderophore ABC transporter substrate-binding protein [Vreelandella andesensis]|uniref:Iron-siderophore ABC transporter substrate-binding protein n=1 Tax=Vreelandella andesensis TaxID=447567 RepID=A0A3S0YK09_9GAMM|nr:iron-siderophore ABC transporter substrate-binding protein [Halomonas andesensis]RUR32099.1 iron-siderophore ABC transporter substrate-binding protein [Halomonas andesensis]
MALGLVAPWAYARVLRDPRDLAVSENQKRIVALDAFFAEMLAAMGLPPVAMPMRAGGAPPPHLADALGDVASVGLHSAPDYEAVIGIRPDLIVGQAARFATEASLLESIAPTLLLNEPADDWREFMTALANGLGRRAEAEQAISAYDRRVANMRESLGNRGRRPTVLLLRVRQKDIRIYGGERRAGLVMYHDLGLVPHTLTPTDKKNITISMEIIPQIDADVLLLMAEDEARMSSIEQTELWRRLPAVQAGQVHRVNMAWWNQSIGPISFGRILDDIGTIFGLSA